MGILLNDSPIDLLTESIKLDHGQAILELAAKPLPETRLFLFICIHVITGILRQCVEGLGILHHTVITLLLG